VPRGKLHKMANPIGLEKGERLFRTVRKDDPRKKTSWGKIMKKNLPKAKSC